MKNMLVKFFNILFYAWCRIFIAISQRGKFNDDYLSYTCLDQSNFSLVDPDVNVYHQSYQNQQ